MYSRKILWTIIVVPLLLNAAILPSARAQSSSSPTVGLFIADSTHVDRDPDPVIVKVDSGPGDSVAIDLKVNGVAELAAFDITVRYPGGFLTADATLEGGTFDNVTGPFAGNMDILKFDVAPDFVRVAIALRGALFFTGDALIARMHYQVNDFGVGVITLPAHSLTLLDVNIDPITPGMIIGTFIVDGGNRVFVTLINRSTQTDFGHVLNIRLEGNIATFKSRVKNIGTNDAIVFARFELRTGDRTLTAESRVVTLLAGGETELFGSVQLEDAPLRYAVTGSIWMSSNGLFFVQSPFGVDTLTFKVLPTCYPNC